MRAAVWRLGAGESEARGLTRRVAVLKKQNRGALVTRRMSVTKMRSWLRNSTSEHQVLRERAKNRDRRMTCWRTAPRPSGPAPAPAAHPEQGAGSTARWVLHISEDQTARHLGSLARCSVTCTAQKCCLQSCFVGNLLHSSLYPLPPFLSPGTAENRAALSSLHSPSKYLDAFLRASSSFTFLALAATALRRKDIPVPSSSL